MNNAERFLKEKFQSWHGLKIIGPNKYIAKEFPNTIFVVNKFSHNDNQAAIAKCIKCGKFFKWDFLNHEMNGYEHCEE